MEKEKENDGGGELRWKAVRQFLGRKKQRGNIEGKEN